MTLQQWFEQHILAAHQRGGTAQQPYGAQQDPYYGVTYPSVPGMAPPPPPPLPPPPPPAPLAGTMSPNEILNLYRPWLEAGIREFPGAPGQYKIPVLSIPVAANTSLPAPLAISLTSALYEVSGAATTGGDATIGNRDAFRIQMFIGGTDQIPINLAPALGSSFFNTQTGVKVFRKPWLVPGSTNLSFILTNITGVDIVIDLTVSLLQLEVAVAGG